MLRLLSLADIEPLENVEAGHFGFLLLLTLISFYT
jgi:hypothetical protein